LVCALFSSVITSFLFYYDSLFLLAFLLFPLFFFNSTSPSEIYTLSLHDALPILYYSQRNLCLRFGRWLKILVLINIPSIKHIKRSEEHTSELQSRFDLVCRLLLEKKKKTKKEITNKKR